jgi:hypothetical protein
MPVGRTSARAVAALSVGALVAGGLALSAPAGAAKRDVHPRSAGYQYGNWSAVSGGFNATVMSLMRLDDTTIVAGGQFISSPGDDTLNGIAKYSGTNWDHLAVDDSGVSPGVARVTNSYFTYPGIFGMDIAEDDSIYAGGVFQFADDDTANNVARWTGSSWERLGTGLRSAKVSEGYVVQDVIVGNDPSNAHDASFADDTIFALGGIAGACPSLNSCADANSTASWQGVMQYRASDSTWISQSPAVFNAQPITGAYLDDTTATDDTVIVAGEFTSIGGVNFNRIAAFSYADDSWHQLGSANFGFNDAVYAATVHPSTGDVYVAGKFTALCTNAACSTTTDISDGVAKWDRQVGEWYSVGSGMTDPNLDDIGFSPNGNVMYVSGFNNTTVGGTAANGIAQLSGGDFSAGATNVGGTWNYIKSAGTIGIQSGAGGRSLVVNNDGSVYVAGTFTQAGPVPARYVALFTPGPEPSPFDPVYPPGVPTDVVATGGWNKVTVEWKAPTYTGSYPITNYLVQASPGGNVCITRLSDPKQNQCTYTSLTPGTQYTFKVQGLNGGGWGDRSAASNVASPQNLKITSYNRKKLNFFRGGGSEVTASGVAPGFAPGTRIVPWVQIGSGAWESAPTSSLAVSSGGKFTWKRKFNKKQNSTPISVKFEIGGNFSNTVLMRPVK